MEFLADGLMKRFGMPVARTSVRTEAYPHWGLTLQPSEPRPQPVQGSSGCSICHSFSCDVDAACGEDHLHTV